jgi:hypothetical protein
LLPSDVKNVGFELVYQTNGVDRGVIGTYRISKGTEKILLGIESSGVFKFDDNVTGGMLTINYTTNGEKVLLRYPFTPTTGDN